MRQPLRGALAATLCVSVFALAAASTAWMPGAAVRTEDHNRDGRPDLWRSYNRHGQIATVAIDTNLDGRADVQEFYEGGALVRRESDRDFNDHVDLIQDFDPTTRQVVRSVADVDADGVADLLVLFQEGQPVYTKWSGRHTPNAGRAPAALPATAARRTNDPLASLEDPFRQDLAIAALYAASSAVDLFAPPTPGGVPAVGEQRTDLPRAADAAAATIAPLSAARAGAASPRGPPASPLPG